MCGSGTFVIEAAEIAAGLEARPLAPLRLRATGDVRRDCLVRVSSRGGAMAPTVRFHGSAATATRRHPHEPRQCRACRRRCLGTRSFASCRSEELVAPEGPAGLVIINPPYGERIGDKRRLIVLHRTLGDRLKARFKGWRVGLVTTEPELARGDWPAIHDRVCTGLAWGVEGAAIGDGSAGVRGSEPPPKAARQSRTAVMWLSQCLS